MVVNSEVKLLLCFLPYFLSLSAQAAGTVAPNAGSLLQQVQPTPPQLPSSSGTGLIIEPEGAGNMPPSAPFAVKVILVSGNTLFDTKLLHALAADAEGKTLTLPDLDELATRITNYYHDHGYPLTRAFIPAQTIQDGVVRIEIIEAKYGNVKIDNHSKVNDSLLDATLANLKSGQAIEQTGMDHALLLLGDIPGVVANPILKPGETVGTSDLMVETTSGPATGGNITLDGYGNRFTGRERASGTLNVFNPLHHGDYLSLNVLTSGNDMNYGRISYESLMNGKGSRLGGSFSTLHYILGDTLVSLNGHGTASTTSLWIKHPFVRTPEVNLYGQFQYDRKQLHDHIDAGSPPSRTDRHLDNWTASLSGDLRDGIMSGGINTWNLGLTSGRIDFDDAAAQSNDAKTASIQGNFSKINTNLARMQRVSSSNTLYLNFSGQWANTNLDSAEKMAVGGPYSVRAYESSVVSGDTGYLLTAEFRRDLGFVWQGQWLAVAFVDNAHITVNKNVWASGTNSATLTGVGVGFIWNGPKQWSAKTYIATTIGQMPVLAGPTNSARGWVEINKVF